METVVLTRQHIAKIVNEKGFDDFMDRMIARLGEVFREGGHGGITPARDGFVRGPGDTAILEWMPHHRPGESITIKTVGYTPSNPAEFRLPTIIGTMTRYDDVTGGCSRSATASCRRRSVPARPPRSPAGFSPARTAGSSGSSERVRRR